MHPVWRFWLSALIEKNQVDFGPLNFITQELYKWRIGLESNVSQNYVNPSFTILYGKQAMLKMIDYTPNHIGCHYEPISLSAEGYIESNILRRVKLWDLNERIILLPMDFFFNFQQPNSSLKLFLL